MSNRVGTVFGLAVLLVAGGAVAESGGAVAAAPPDQFPVQYMVKFVCGLAPIQPAGEEPPVKPGNYATAINFHNYTLTPLDGSFRVALHYRPGGPGAPVFPAKRVVFRRLQVLEIDCLEIWAAVSVPPGTFLKGMVHVGILIPLPVAAVYTSQTNLGPGTALDPGAGISIDVEEIHPFIDQRLPG